MAIKTTRTGWTYTGDLETNIVSARKRVEMLERNSEYIRRVYEEAEKRYQRHFASIRSMKRFIEVATEQLEQERNGKSNDDSKA